MPSEQTSLYVQRRRWFATSPRAQADSAKHYKIARGEAMECAASLDVLKLRRLIKAEPYDLGIQLLEGVVGMLTKMI